MQDTMVAVKRVSEIRQKREGRYQCQRLRDMINCLGNETNKNLIAIRKFGMK